MVALLSVHIDVVSYQRVLGDELRRLRKQRAWTRKDLNDRLQSDISLQTLATYELGTRQISVIRLVELCIALGELPHDLLARVHERVFAGEESGKLRIDLRAVVRDTQPELLPLRRWALGRLNDQDSSTEVSFDIAALERMAELCGIELVDLITRLRRIGGG